jgi:uncharacterized protein with ParB-like and HNH nuclease domain
MSTLLKQEQPTFGSLAGNGRTFEVPPFQRDYSWDKEEWEDLWLDLIGIEDEGDHYMGYVVLQETKESKNFLIIDGQQRIATISILIIAAVKVLQDRGDKERAELLRNTYLSYKEPSSLIHKTKLKLNRNNDHVYASQLLQLQIPQYTAGLKPSEKRLIGAFKYFSSELSKLFKDKQTETIAAFISKKVDEKLFFTSITVGDDIDAYKVFETLNARGVKLSTADLLKNYLFSKVFSRTPGEVEILEKKWYKINDLLGKTDITNYIRHYWNSRNYPTERKATLFKTIKKKVDSYELSIDMINSLDESVLIYSALVNSDSEIWVGEQSKFIEEINVLEVSQCFPLLMVGKQKFSDTEYSKLLRDVVALSFRYNTIGGQNPNELERVYGKASVAIFKGEITTAKELFQKHLKDVYLDDNSFKNDFKNKQINTNKYNFLVKYILGKLEVQYGGSEVILTSKNLTIEHILPENPTDEWVSQFQNVDVQDYIFRLGNFTLLESAKNKEADRKPFTEKQIIYATSNYKLSKEQINYSVWNVTSISARQSDMANKAATVWKINYQ